MWRVKWFTLHVMDLAHLEALRDKRASLQDAADAIRDQIHEHIRKLPPTTDKVALQRASGLSRPTIYRLLGEGQQQRSGTRGRGTSV